MKRKFILLIVVLVIFSLMTACDKAVEETSKVQEQTSETDNTEVASDANIIHLNDDNYHEVMDNSEGIAIVDFWAPWCNPCLQLGPILEEISAEEGITLYKVNVDECPGISTEFQITGIPMVFLYKDGEPVDAQMGAGNKQLYLEMIARHK